MLHPIIVLIGFVVFILFVFRKAESQWRMIVRENIIENQREAIDKLESEVLRLMDEQENRRDEMVESWFEDELSDYNTVLHHLTDIYMHCSGGRVSKPMTLPSEVILLLEERQSEDINESIRNAVEEHQHYRTALEKLLLELTPGSFTSLNEYEHVNKFLRETLCPVKKNGLVHQPPCTCPLCCPGKWAMNQAAITNNL